MKIRQKMMVIFAAVLFFLTYSIPAFTAKASCLSEETSVSPSSVPMFDEASLQETAVLTEEIMTEEEASLPSAKESLTESTTVTKEDPSISFDEESLPEGTTITKENPSISFDEKSLPETTAITEGESSAQSVETALQETTSVAANTDTPSFAAAIEYSFQGYLVMGTFTEFPTDIIHIQPFYSLNDKTYHECGEEWDLHSLEAFQVAKKKRLICLYSNNEPLKSYLEGSLERFYLKLRITKENGMIYETQTVLIDRGAPQPFPEGLTLGAKFSSNMLVCERKPFHCYGKYQITVKETVSPKDITAVLPDTLPVEVQLLKKGNVFTNGVVDCPVTWKSLSLPSLTAGESVTIEDAAEEIIIPGGTLLHTPMGIFRFDEPFGVNQDDVLTDEVRLVLNVVSQSEKPTGALAKERDGLEITFHQKPTGATSIRAYTISENETKWTKLPGLALLEAVNAQPSTPNSGYTVVLRNDQEPYRSYLAAETAKDTPTPFFIGLEISGGVYDGQQLILAWPSDYALPLQLPKLGGAGGNESNAGADNKGDSTAEGQRPNLPQNTDTKKEEQNPNPSQSSNTKNQHTENQNSISTVEISTESDFESQRIQEDKRTPDRSDAAAFAQPAATAQTAFIINTENNDAETVPATDVQTKTHIKNEVSETLPAENKLSAALTSSKQEEKADHDVKTGIHRLLFWIAAAAIAGICIILYTCKGTVTPSCRIAKKIKNALHGLLHRK